MARRTTMIAQVHVPADGVSSASLCGQTPRGYPEFVTRPANPARWLRAAVLGVASVGLAAGGHIVAGGHVEPVFAGLLVIAAVLSSHAWLHRERGLLAITVAVVAVQIGVHLGLAVGHDHRAGTTMLVAHAGAALLLALFLRSGEARLHAAARRRYLRLLIAAHLLLAGVPRALPQARTLVGKTPMRSLWVPAPGLRRGPPVAA